MTDDAHGTSQPRGRFAAGAVAGLLAAGVALGMAQLAAVVVDGQAAPVIAVGSAFIDATPVWLKDFAIRTFGTNDKPVLIGSIFVVLALLACVTGALSVRRPVAGYAGVAALGGVGAVAALSRPTASAVWAIPSVVGAVAGLGALAVLLRPLWAGPGSAPERTTRRDPTGPPSWTERVSGYLGGVDRKGAGFDRRAFLVSSIGAAAVGAAAGGAGRAALAKRFDVTASREAVRLPAPASPAGPVPSGADLELPGLSRFRTPTNDFYRVDTALVVPQVSTQDWRLRVHGMVDHELELTFDDLLQRRMIERDVTLTCVSNEVGGEYVGSARWLGAPLADLLREAGVHGDADQLVSRSQDGMTIGTPTAVVMDGRDAMLAVGMNGKPLPAVHGFPVRMVVPGLYGYVSATKWVVDLELTTFARTRPYWVKRGWVAKAPIKTMSRIDTPRPLARLKPGTVAVAGVAWAQHRGVRGVEVRVDGGPWAHARLAASPSVDTWVQWVWEWAAEPGNHTLEVRATDRSGATQPEKRTQPFPSGATGWHSTVVTVA